jgi:hypothetical protein
MKLKCKEVFLMSNGSLANFTLNKPYSLHTLDNKEFFVVDDQEQIHKLPWPYPEDDFNTLDYFDKG